MDVVNWQEVRLLLAALQESDVTELILEYKDFRLTLRKGIPAGLAAAAAAPPAAPKVASTIPNTAHTRHSWLLG